MRFPRRGMKLTHDEICIVSDIRKELVILMRNEGHTYQAIADAFEISRERARQIYMKDKWQRRREAKRRLARIHARIEERRKWREFLSLPGLKVEQ